MNRPSASARRPDGRGALVIVAAIVAGASAFPAQASPVPGRATAFPGANGRIAFTRFVGGSIAIFSINPDGTDLRQITTPDYAVEDDVPAWAPDSSAIVFQRCVKGVCHLWRMNADGGDLHQLGATTGLPPDDFEDGASYAPDGMRIVFHRGYGRRSDGRLKVQGLFTMASDGSGMRQLTQRGVRAPKVADFKPSWSPNGKAITFVREKTNCGLACTGAVYSMHPDGTHLKQLTTFGDYSAVHWSPSGRTLVFRYARSGRQRQVFTMRPDGSHRLQLTHFPASTEVATPAFSPDGRSIVVGFGPKFQPDLYVMNADGTDVRPVTSGHHFDSAMDWGRAT